MYNLHQFSQGSAGGGGVANNLRLALLASQQQQQQQQAAAAAAAAAAQQQAAQVSLVRAEPCLRLVFWFLGVIIASPLPSSWANEDRL